MFLYYFLVFAVIGYLVSTKLSYRIFHVGLLFFVVVAMSTMKTYVEGFVAYEIPDEDHAGDTSLGAKQEHLELAYRLCMYDPSSSCQDYVHHYDMLKSSHRRLRKGFCDKHPDQCEKLGL